MQSTAIDSGPLIALFNRSDRHHEEAVDYLRSSHSPLVTTLPVVTEVTHMLGFSTDAQLAFLGWAEQALTIDSETHADLARICTIIDKYRDRPADFADASIVAMCERRSIRAVASIDSDFDIYRLHEQTPIENPLRAPLS